MPGGYQLSKCKGGVHRDGFGLPCAVQRALLRTAQEIAKGMEYIHDFDIVHGDLKPGNVLLKTHKVDRRGYIAKVRERIAKVPRGHWGAC